MQPEPLFRVTGRETQQPAILAILRELSRTYSLALLLVHHARKAGGEPPLTSVTPSDPTTPTRGPPSIAFLTARPSETPLLI